MDCDITGIGYYGVHEILELIRIPIHGVVKRTDFTLYENTLCNDIYELGIAKSQFCGIPQVETTFLEVRD